MNVTQQIQLMKAVEALNLLRRAKQMHQTQKCLHHFLLNHYLARDKALESYQVGIYYSYH